VVKDAVLAQHPHVATALLDAFTAAKQPYLERLKAGVGSAPEDVRYRSFAALMSDPLPYGIKANRASIEALITYALQQGLIPKRPAVSDVFFDPEAA
jgi:4,5-dihydroxyphthalate decarboxylase